MPTDPVPLTEEELDALELAHTFYPYEASEAVLRVISELRQLRREREERQKGGR